MALKKEEITRKLLHLFALLMPAGIFYLPKMDFSYAYPVGILTFLLGGSIVVESLRFRVPAVQKLFFSFFGHLLRQEESSKTTGSTYVIGAALLCSVLFRNQLHIAFMVLSLFILGDAIAAIVGLSMGRIKIGKKSLEGSAACFLLCMALMYGIFPYMPGILEPWGGRVPFLMALAASLSITVFELVPLKITSGFTINDNLAVPVITGGILVGMEHLLGF
ncbi:MAG: diacylglycerol/polyprenol kinase family protein [Chitinispirillaceae bacterium]